MGRDSFEFRAHGEGQDMTRTSWTLRAACASAAAAMAIMAVTTPASAYIEGNPLTVTALTSGHTATWVLPIDAGTWQGQDWHYDSAGHTYQMWDGSTLVGTLSGI